VLSDNQNSEHFGKLVSFWGFAPRPHRGSPGPAGDFHPPDPLGFAPPGQISGYAIACNRPNLFLVSVSSAYRNYHQFTLIPRCVVFLTLPRSILESNITVVPKAAANSKAAEGREYRGAEGTEERAPKPRESRHQRRCKVS